MTEETSRVRIAVMINGKGEWNAEGWCEGATERMLESLRHTFIDCDRFDEHTVIRWVEADVPIPKADTCTGHVVPWPSEGPVTRA